MCGIAGFVATDHLPPDTRDRAVRMRDVIVHRGPDDAGLYIDDRAALAHRRLSIVDLAGGGQPLSNEDGTMWIVFNGEIYNHTALRRRLETLGHRYRTQSDTETILHAYEEWGDDCVHRFRGMFAFAIWDAAKRRLLLARDRLGVKPMYWARRADLLLFASEIKAILASGLVEAEPDSAAIPELLSTRSIAGSGTLFRGVRKLLPGHLLVFERAETKIRRYWDLPVGGARDISHEAWRDPRDVVDRFRALLEEAVRLRLMSDVPIGMLLSGGIDSSAVAAIMARQINTRLQTFSVAFREQAFNELAYAKDVARAVGAESHETIISDRDFFGALPKLLWHEDEPMAHPSSVALYFVSMLAGRHVTVVLTGEGSDELLAGYGKYLRTRWNWRAAGAYRHIVPPALRRAIAAGLAPRIPLQLGRYVRRSFLALDRSPEAMCFDNFAAVPLADQHRLLSRDLRSLITHQHAYGTCAAHFHRPDGDSSLLDRLLYADVKTYLVELLMKQDQMSMAASIESRVPFLDHQLVEFAARLPDAWKLSGLTTKRVLREAMKGLLPDSILNRPKVGFPVPFSLWMRREWNAVARDVLLDRRSRERGVFDPGAVGQLLDRHKLGSTDGGDRIWSLLNLELWYRTYIDKDGVQTLPEAAAPGASALNDFRAA